MIQRAFLGLGLLLALLGHTIFWVGLVNRMHGRAWPEWRLRFLMACCVAMWTVLLGGFLGIAFGGPALENPSGLLLPGWLGRLGWAWGFYLLMCWIVAGLNLWTWWWRHVLHRPPKVLVSHQVESISLPRAVQTHPEHHPLVWLPQNEILQLQLTRREIELAHLAPQWDGLTLLHLSDFHFTGRVAQDWFQEAADYSAQLKPDLIALTGDFLDSMDCLDWIPEVLRPLKGRWGVYFILGNHDWRLDWPRIREQIIQLGFISLGGRWTLLSAPSPSANGFSPADPITSSQNGDRSILLAGSELPWIGPAPDMSSAPRPASEGGPLRILLTHSPDQLGWARRHHFDLMLAGHTHGGQIRIPGIGAILTPSRMGVRYSGGVFHEPPTVMHVTRGISAEWPLRWNCPPEVALLVLRSPACPSRIA